MPPIGGGGKKALFIFLNHVGRNLIGEKMKNLKKCGKENGKEHEINMFFPLRMRA